MKTGVILLGHGSRREEANSEIREFAQIMQKEGEAPGGSEDISGEALYKEAFLSFGDPDLGKAIDELVKSGVEKVLVTPLFLVTGNHIQRDIPEQMEEIASRYPEVKFILTPHLGVHHKLVEIVKERIKEAEAGT